MVKGDKYNKLTAIEFDHRNKHGSQCWLFICDCGNIKVIRMDNVKNGGTKSCGCSKKNNKNGLMHGMFGTPIYYSWTSMKQRCLNSNHQAYKHYGGRGIKICKRWINSFENFFADMGERPKGKTLDRFPNNDGNYEPKNCRWATPKQQRLNQRFIKK